MQQSRKYQRQLFEEMRAVPAVQFPRGNCASKRKLASWAVSEGGPGISATEGT
jgi:hypothetical protein